MGYWFTHKQQRSKLVFLLHIFCLLQKDQKFTLQRLLPLPCVAALMVPLDNCCSAGQKNSTVDTGLQNNFLWQIQASSKPASFAIYSRAFANGSTPKGGGQTAAFRALSGLSFPHTTSTVTGGGLGPINQPGPLRDKILSCCKNRFSPDKMWPLH